MIDRIDFDIDIIETQQTCAHKVIKYNESSRERVIILREKSTSNKK